MPSCFLCRRRRPPSSGLHLRLGSTSTKATWRRTPRSLATRLRACEVANQAWKISCCSYCVFSPANEFRLATSLAAKRKRSDSVSKNEDALGCKREFVGYIDANNPPKCRCLTGDADLPPIESKRLANFAKALRRRWKPWLEQLPSRVRLAIDREALPEEHCKHNGNQFMEESFADNASLMSPCSGCEEASGRMVGTLMSGPLCSMLP